jgi:DeoR/GlpR family transcriptional regulator of sugar metabolism
VTDINLQEAQIKTRMVQPARRTVAFADGAKVGKTSVARIARIDEVDHLVTTASAKADVLASIEGLGVNVTIVP